MDGHVVKEKCQLGIYLYNYFDSQKDIEIPNHILYLHKTMMKIKNVNN